MSFKNNRISTTGLRSEGVIIRYNTAHIGYNTGCKAIVLQEIPFFL